jgi:DNA-binding transcriptional LysR family regulator
MTDRFTALKLFARVARAGSFSRAGRELGMSQPSVSRVIAALEKEVGAGLLMRTTRALTLTEAGADYLARIEPILAALEEADYAARGTGELRGMLRVAMSSSFAVREAIPRLPAFMARHPALRIELLMSDHYQDLVSEGADVALRFGAMSDSSATARRLCAFERVLVASPSYLARAGVPVSPGDLAAHAVIAGPSGVNWSFEREGRTASVRVDGKLGVSVNEGAVAAAVAGLGIAATAILGCRAELERGALARVLEGWRLAPVELHAVFPAGRAAKPAARALAEHLSASLADAQAAKPPSMLSPAPVTNAASGLAR